MTTDLKYHTFSFQINFIVKLALVVTSFFVLISDLIYLPVLLIISWFTLLFKKPIRDSWLKIVSKLSYFLIAYLVLDYIFTSDIETALSFIAKLLVYLLFIVWIKESTSISSYLSDIYSATFLLGVNFISRKIDRFFHYFNFYLIATSKFVEKFTHNYDANFKLKGSLINLFFQVFLDTMLRIPETKEETNNIMSVINYRKFSVKANLPIIGLIILISCLALTNCEGICLNFLSK